MSASSVEPQARRYLRLFPLWMRSERGEEAVGLALDQLPAGATRLPARTRLDLLRAGLHARRRGTPPPRVWSQISYSSAFRNDPVVPTAWRPWLASVIMTRWITVAYVVTRTAPLLVVPFMQVLLPVSDDPMIPRYFFLGWVALAFGLWAVGGRRWRRRVLLANGFDLDGRPLPPDQLRQSWSQQTVPNTWTVPTLAGFALMSGVYGPVAWFEADRSRHPGLLLSLAVLGAIVWAVAVARRRLDRIVASPPEWTLPNVGLRRSLLSLAGGAGAGLLWTWIVVAVAESIGLSPVVFAAGPAGAALVLAWVRQTEQRTGRRIGAWDLHPAWAPQPVQRPAEHAPTPPDGPSTPALG